MPRSAAQSSPEPQPAKPKSSPARERPSLESLLAQAVASTTREHLPREKRPVRVVTEFEYAKPRAPHKMMGKRGWSVVSNAFLSQVLAPVIAAKGMTPTEVAVLLYCMGEQEEGILVIKTQQTIANFLALPRTNVSAALTRIENWHMIRRDKKDRTVYQVNPTLCFKGNGDAQQEMLDTAMLMRLGPGDFPDLVVPTPKPRKPRAKKEQKP